jgi:hypothetical protein
MTLEYSALVMVEGGQEHFKNSRKNSKGTIMNSSTRSLGRVLAIMFVMAFSLPLAVLAEAEERKAAAAPVSNPSPASSPEPSVFGLDAALGLAGLPGMSSPSDDDESTYEKAWRMQDGPNGTTRLTYGERYRRNPDGSYGARSSSRWDGGNVGDRLLDMALSAGGGWFSSWAEGWLGGYGKARISVRLNDEGQVTGSGDFLYPIYDSEGTAVFTQMGLRTMTGDRVIGNFGLGQRFFPAPNFAFGYNIFLDQDFTREHTRGGAGVEAWYDWLRLSANYYTPLSDWKGSEDYDSRLVEERPAEGYDARLTGYLPFYRNLAVTGAFEQWRGDRVGSFGSGDFTQKDPKVWSYGLEWTPVPAFSTSLTQRHSGSQEETQFGITFNYLFGMAWEDQLSPATVAEMRTVDGSRHDFVNRQNEMILEYRVKEGAFNIIQRGMGVTNIFVFQITNGFGEAVAGQRVAVSLPAGVVDSGNGVYTTDGNGLISIALTTVPATAVPTVATLTAGKTSRTFTLGSASTLTSGTLIFLSTDGGDFNDPNTGYQSTATVTLEKYVDDNGEQSLPVGAHVVWSVKSVANPSASSAPWWKRSATAKNGLTWGDSADGTRDWAADAVVETPVTTAAVKITDVVGSRSVTLEAAVCIGGNNNETTESACTGNSGTWYTGEQEVTFGAGPLSVFATDPTLGKGNKAWAILYGTSGNGNGDFTSSSNTFPAAVAAGGNVRHDSVSTSGTSPGMTAIFQTPDWETGEIFGGHYSTTAKLPKVSQLLAVARYSSYESSVPRKGAAFAAGWPDDGYDSGWYVYWSGEVFFNDVGYFGAWFVYLDGGTVGWDDVAYGYPVAVGVLP